MDNVTLQRIKDVLSKNESIAIAVGQNPSIDDMGAALSLYLAFTGIRKKVSIASATPPIVELSNLVGIDKVKGHFEGTGSAGGDLVVSFPYREGEIEKVSYTIENNYLNIVVKAGPQGLNFQEQDVKYSRGGGGTGAIPVLFVVGTPRLSDLGQLFNPEALKETTVINIDNKSDNQGFGDVVMVSPKASSVSEIVADILFYLGIDFDVDTAQNLLDGISYATNNFQSSRTDFVAFEIAGQLMRKGAVRIATQPGGFPTLQGAPTQSFAQNSPIPAPRPQAQSPFPSPRSQFPQAQPQPQPRPQFPQAPRQPQPQAQPQPQPFPRVPRQPQQTQAPQDPYDQFNGLDDQDNRKPPADWLTPKVYKGSSNVE